MGKRIYASSFLLMWLDSLLFADTKKEFHFWRSETAVCGISLDLKIQARPVIEWAAPLDGLGLSEKRWIDPSMSLWEACPPSEGGRRSLFYRVVPAWAIGPVMPEPSEMALKTIRLILGELGFGHVKLTTHSARNPPTPPAPINWGGAKTTGERWGAGRRGRKCPTSTIGHFASRS